MKRMSRKMEIGVLVTVLILLGCLNFVVPFKGSKRSNSLVSTTKFNLVSMKDDILASNPENVHVIDTTSQEEHAINFEMVVENYPENQPKQIPENVPLQTQSSVLTDQTNSRGTPSVINQPTQNIASPTSPSNTALSSNSYPATEKPTPSVASMMFRDFTKSEISCYNFDTSETHDRLLSTCSVYINEFGSWSKGIETKNRTVFAWQWRSGTGDRLAGLVSAFHYALTTHRRLIIKWDGLDAVFDVPCYLKNMVKIENTPGDVAPNPHKLGKCAMKSVVAGRLAKDTCKSRSAHLTDSIDFIRASASKERCKVIDSWINQPSTMAHTTGCPVALMLQPKKSFLERRVSFFMDGEEHEKPLNEMVTMLRNYNTIALHYRVGDEVMTSTTTDSQTVAGILESRLNRTMNCLRLVSNYTKTNEKPDKPVKWIIASDSVQLRDYFQTHYPKRVIILTAPPVHIYKSHVEDIRQSTIETMTEFYLLGKADKIVVWHSRMRMSSFSKFARLFALKSQVYAILFRRRQCRLLEVAYDGNTNLFPKECTKNEHLGHFTDFNVEHNTWAYQQPLKHLEQPHLIKQKQADETLV